eukprot:TRINITY_DN26327_c0_g1_i1.p1 TRINITY_DN26327_c0_g1~~TRINITY_DN26327_c0_g1_i1.p1  ORF type:complete len:396 (+),score=45.88 TRINITY_DN26327_c0_g1_i1:87-1274(+)
MLASPRHTEYPSISMTGICFLTASAAESTILSLPALPARDPSFSLQSACHPKIISNPSRLSSLACNVNVRNSIGNRSNGGCVCSLASGWTEDSVRPLDKISRRHISSLFISFPALFVLPFGASAEVASDLLAPAIDFSKEPSQAFDPTDRELQDAATIFQRALEASSVEEEERLWTQVIERYGAMEAEWVPDIVGRAWGNRGNARSRQGRMEQALGDYAQAMKLAPYAVDPVLNRGVALENLGRYDEAARDYRAVLAVDPRDPAAWNNLGNVTAAQGLWDEALEEYKRAVQLAPDFSFAAANYALALYQVERSNEAIKSFRSLLRKYPEFPDMRAALAVSLYKEGLTAEAETNWGRVEDVRYRNRIWVRQTRRWPPRLADALESFLDLTPSKGPL